MRSSQVSPRHSARLTIGILTAIYFFPAGVSAKGPFHPLGPPVRNQFKPVSQKQVRGRIQRAIHAAGYKQVKWKVDFTADPKVPNENELSWKAVPVGTNPNQDAYDRPHPAPQKLPTGTPRYLWGTVYTGPMAKMSKLKGENFPPSGVEFRRMKDSQVRK